MKSLLEPALVAFDVSGVELFIGLGEINDAFHQADESANTSNKGKHDLDDAFLGVAKVELVDAESSDKDSQDSCG